MANIVFFNRLFHWGPLAAIGIINCVSFTTLHCSSMWWPFRNSWGGLLNCALFITLSALTIFNFVSAMFKGPGYLPLKWKPENENDTQYMQYCSVCQGYKAPRSHHCRKCNRCVMKMDHHCPWINTCVGHFNHGNFTAFLLWAVLGCAQACLVLSCSLYCAVNRTWYLYYGNGTEPNVQLGLFTFTLCIFSLGVSCGVMLSVSMLLYFQVKSILKNQTGIEDWIIEKANARRDGTPFIYPYDMGWQENCKQVINWSCAPLGDGYHWPVQEGCHEYTLTIEQQKQKNEKRQRTRLYTVVHGFSGWWLPVVYGWRVFCSPPYSDESRLKLDMNDNVRVTRWRKHWLFGEKEGQEKRLRGWFPRVCVVEVTEHKEHKTQ